MGHEPERVPGRAKPGDRIRRARDRLTGDVQDPVDVQEDARHGPGVSQRRRPGGAGDARGRLARRDVDAVARRLCALYRPTDVEDDADLPAPDVHPADEPVALVRDP